MNKRGTRPEYRMIVQLILFVAVSLAIALPFYNRWVEVRLGKPSSGTERTLDTIRIEVNNLYDKTEIPMYIDENHVIKIFPVGSEERPDFNGCKEEKDKSCICVCTVSSCNIAEGEVNKCKAFDGDFFKETYTIDPKIVDGKAVTMNCVFEEIENEGGKIRRTSCN